MASCKRPRLISLYSFALSLLKPRFGSRRCRGIWPPSKPPRRTPARAVWPLPPRPPVLPMPEPMPRPMRTRTLRDPGLSLSSLSRIEVRRSRCLTLSSLVVDHPHEVADLGDHAAHGGRILGRAPPAQLVEAEADQRLLLDLGPADGAADLLDRYGLAASSLAALLSCHCTSPRIGLFTPSRRPPRSRRPSRRGD